MTVRLKPTTGTRRTRRPADSEDRYTLKVTIAFIVLIVIVILTVVVSVGYGYYTSHFKPIANVGSASISRDQWGSQITLETYRLHSLEGRTRTAINAGLIDATAGAAILSDITTKLTATTLAGQAANDLVDLAFKEQLAASNDVTVTDADIDAQMAIDASAPEQRHVLAIVVGPKPALAGTTPTPQDNQTAYTAALAAQAALASGTPIGQLAAQYNTDASKGKSGDLGFIQATDTSDPTFVDAIFRLALNGVTPLIKGADGVYRIGTVTEIRPGVLDSNFRKGAEDAIGVSQYRDEIRREAIAAKLSTKIASNALASTVTQVRVAEILVSIAGTDPSTDVQIHASHILYSPKHDPQNLASLPPDDPAWAAAKASADATAAALNAITDITQREARFQEIAKSESDDKTSGAAGGELGTFTRDAMVPEFATPLFDNTNLKPGDIVGPVKSAFGWHVILFQQRVPSANDRLNAVNAALAQSVGDFGSVAKQFSDGNEAQQGGERGWLTGSELPSGVATKVLATDVGFTTDPIQVDTGYYIEKVEEKATRTPEGQEAAVIAASAFTSWYADQKSKATKAKLIVTDSAIFSAN